MIRTRSTTISIPKELKARMEAANGTANWSAVAARAFEQHLAASGAASPGPTDPLADALHDLAGAMRELAAAIKEGRGV